MPSCTCSIDIEMDGSLSWSTQSINCSCSVSCDGEMSRCWCDLRDTVEPCHSWLIRQPVDTYLPLGHWIQREKHPCSRQKPCCHTYCLWGYPLDRAIFPTSKNCLQAETKAWRCLLLPNGCKPLSELDSMQKANSVTLPGASLRKT